MSEKKTLLAKTKEKEVQHFKFAGCTYGYNNSRSSSPQRWSIKKKLFRVFEYWSEKSGWSHDSKVREMLGKKNLLPKI